MAILVDAVLLNVSILLNDANMVHWTQEELLAWGTEGQVELVKLRPDASSVTVDVQLVSGAKQFAPDGTVAILGISQNKDGSAISLCDRQTLDQFRPDWMVTSITPTPSTVTHWMPDVHPDTFYVYPAQGTSPGTVLMTHSVLPPPLAANGNLGVRDMYQSAIENYILYRAFSKDSSPANAERAMAYAKAFYG